MSETDDASDLARRAEGAAEDELALGREAQALDGYERATRLWARAGDRASEARCLEQTIRLRRTSGDAEGDGLALLRLGELASQGYWGESALALFRQALAQLEDEGDPLLIAAALEALAGELHRRQLALEARGHWQRARALYQQRASEAGLARCQRQLDAIEAKRRALGLAPAPTVPPPRPGPRLEREAPRAMIADLVRAIRAAGLTAHEPRILETVRPAIELEALPCAQAELPLGASRMGGMPDLPPDLDWPCYKGVPMAFVAQLDLATLPLGLGLPERGLLSFFHCFWHPGDDPNNARVHLYEGDPAALIRAEHPFAEEATAEDVFAPHRLTLRERLSIPGNNAKIGAEMREEGEPRYLEFSRHMELGHQMLGHGATVQQTPEGLDGSVCLLLQLGQKGLPVGRPLRRGFFYFWLLREDLAARRFEQAWATFERG